MSRPCSPAMSGSVRAEFARSTKRLLPLAVVVAALAACAEPGADPAAPELGGLGPAASLTGNGNLEVTVRRSTGELAELAVVTVVHPSLGPVDWKVTDANGFASFNTLPEADVCVHARYDITLDAAIQPLFPFPFTDLEELDLDVTRAGQAAAITTGPNASAALTLGSYHSCLAKPPVRVKSNNVATVALTLRPAATLDLTILGLDGVALGDGAVYAGIVTPFGSCADFPWLASNPSLCSDDDLILPGFVNSVNLVGSPALVSAPANLDFVIEVLQQVPGQGPLTITKKDHPKLAAGAAATATLQLEPMLCEIEYEPEAIGDGKGIDIGNSPGSPMHGKVKHGIQATYPDLDPDPTAVAVWWEQTGSGSMSFSTRTYAPGFSTLSTTVSFVVAADGTCGQSSFSKSPGGNPINGSVFCSPQPNGSTRVTVRHTDLPANWTGHEFNIQGGGDKVPDASKQDKSRAFVPVSKKTACSVQLTNDDRWCGIL